MIKLQIHLWFTLLGVWMTAAHSTLPSESRHLGLRDIFKKIKYEKKHLQEHYYSTEGTPLQYANVHGTNLPTYQYGSQYPYNYGTNYPSSSHVNYHRRPINYYSPYDSLYQPNRYGYSKPFSMMRPFRQTSYGQEGFFPQRSYLDREIRQNRFQERYNGVQQYHSHALSALPSSAFNGFGAI